MSEERQSVVQQQSQQPAPTGLLQRQCACGQHNPGGGECESCKRKRLQRAGDGPAPDVAPPIVHEVLSSPGRPLEAATRAALEPRFGHDFSRVRVHTDARAAESARSVGAVAYTVGGDIAFDSGRYAPGTPSGDRLLAHELAHVVQQRGVAAGIQASLAPDVPGNAAEQEAERAATAVTRGEPANVTTTIAPGIARQMDAGVGPTDASLPGGVSTPPPTPSGPAPSPGPPSPTTSSCRDWQVRMLIGHTTAARTWINDVEPKLQAFRAGTAAPGVATVVRAALNANFHTTAASDVATLAANFASLKSALNGALDYECVSSFWCDQNDLAYVRGRFAWIRRLGDINMCPLWFNCGNYFKRVSTIVHEVAHQHPGAADQAYEHEGAYASLAPAVAMDNADSYAVATRQIYHGGAHGPGETC